MFNKYKHCFGITLFRLKQKQVELWLCLPNRSVGKHIHETFESNILLLCGKVSFHAEFNGLQKSSTKHFTWFKIPINTPHWFTYTKKTWLPTIFINIENWLLKPTSACKDFVKV